MPAARKATALVLLGLLLQSCTVSHVDPNATIDISGTVQRQSGAPVSDAPLALLREGDVGDVLLAISTFGTACLAGKQAPAICHNARVATTGSDGRFTYTLKGRETQSSFGFSAVLSVTTKLGPKADEVSGSATTYRFHVQTKQLQLPIRFWEPTLAARTGSFGARASFPGISPSFFPRRLRQGTIGYTIEFMRGDEIVWRLPSVRSVTTFDPRLLEDSTGTMRVIATAFSLHVPEQLGDEVAFALSSGARAYESPVAPPASRGKGCSVVDPQGKLVGQAPCRLTDGDFGHGFDPTVCPPGPNCAEPLHRSAIVDLGSAQRIDLIVVRGCDGTCIVETSTDRRSWRSAGVTTEDDAAFPSATRRDTRYVRVTASSVDNLTEVSAWNGVPRLPDASMLVSPVKFPSAGGRNTSTPSTRASRSFAWWAVIAALLIGGVIGATITLIARRRREAA